MSWSGKEEDRAQAAGARTIYLLASGNSKLEFAKNMTNAYLSNLCIYISKKFRCSLIVIILVSVVSVGVWKTNNPQHQNVLVVIVFVLSWLPLNLYNLITDLLKALQGWAEIKCWRLSFKVQAQGRRINNSIPQDWLLSKQRQCHGKEN